MAVGCRPVGSIWIAEVRPWRPGGAWVSAFDLTGVQAAPDVASFLPRDEVLRADARLNSDRLLNGLSATDEHAVKTAKGTPERPLHVPRVGRTLRNVKRQSDALLMLSSSQAGSARVHW